MIITPLCNLRETRNVYHMYNMCATSDQDSDCFLYASLVQNFNTQKMEKNQSNAKSMRTAEKIMEKLQQALKKNEKNMMQYGLSKQVHTHRHSPT
jgi:hypothetical protein